MRRLLVISIERYDVSGRAGARPFGHTDGRARGKAAGRSVEGMAGWKRSDEMMGGRARECVGGHCGLEDARRVGTVGCCTEDGRADVWARWAAARKTGGQMCGHGGLLHGRREGRRVGTVGCCTEDERADVWARWAAARMTGGQRCGRVGRRTMRLLTR